MKSPRESSRLAVVLFAIAALAACGAKTRAPEAAADRYEMRGEIVRLPAAGARDIQIRHEAVPDFRDEQGGVVGMEAMTMPFVLAEGVGIEGLATGDAVSFTLEVRWSADQEPLRIAKLEKSNLIEKIDLESGTLPAGQETPTPK